MSSSDGDTAGAAANRDKANPGTMSFTRFSLTHKFVRFGANLRGMTRKMNLHCFDDFYTY